MVDVEALLDACWLGFVVDRLVARGAFADVPLARFIICVERALHKVRFLDTVRTVFVLGGRGAFNLLRLI